MSDIGKPLSTETDRSLAAARATFENAFDILLYTLSDTSKRIYAHTYRKWQAFCEVQDIHALELSAAHVRDFLEQEEIAHSTRQARLSHLRRLVETAAAQQPDNIQLEGYVRQLNLLKIQRSNTDKQAQRTKHALTPHQIHRAFDVWNEDSRRHIRNRAMLAVLFYAGLRRAELVALRWDDINFDERLISVRHGKGDKARTIPMVGDTLPECLHTWHHLTPGREWIFCGFYRGDSLRPDTPVSTNAVYDVIRQTGQAIGVDDFSPHDARRTVLTRMLQAGSSVADTQFIAGHASPQTTLDYAVVKDAKEVAGRIKIDY